MGNFLALEIVKGLSKVNISGSVITATWEPLEYLKDIRDHGLLRHGILLSDDVIEQVLAEPHLNLLILVDTDHTIGDPDRLELLIDRPEPLKRIFQQPIDIALGQLHNFTKPEPDVLQEYACIVVCEDVELVEIAEALEVEHLDDEGWGVAGARLEAALFVLGEDIQQVLFAVLIGESVAEQLGVGAVAVDEVPVRHAEPGLQILLIHWFFEF